MSDLSYVKIILMKELDEKQTITLQEIYKILETQLPEIDKKKRNHKVRSLLDQLRRTNSVKRVGPSTWEKI